MRLLIALCFGLSLVACADDVVPESLAAANLPQKDWSPEQQKLAAKITLKRTYQINAVLETAAKKGDAQLAVVAYNSSMDDFGAFINAGMYPALGQPYRNCTLMLQNQAEAAKAVASGGPLVTDRVDAARSACRSDIG